ncbi:MAG TPA: glycogen debranching N-terminal domain-containing protein [Streptosporangiaceae bacterium]
MTEGWGYDGSPHSRAADGTLTLVEGVTFCISDTGGDIGPGAERGLYYRDTRFLSRFEAEIDGQRLDPLTFGCPNRYTGVFVGRRPPRSGAADSTLLVVRRRYVGNGMMEEITLRNLGTEKAGVILSVTVDADFAGLFEVKEDRVHVREDTERSAGPDGLRLGYRHGRGSRGVTVTGTGDPVVTSQQLLWRPVLDPRSEWTVTIAVLPAMDGAGVPPRYRPGQPVEASGPATMLARWREATPAVSTPDEGLAAMLAVSAEDLGALRIFDGDQPDRSVVAAGAPWFMTLFGRDALLTSWMLLPLDPSLALGTLDTLARLQGTRTDPLTEEEPGRILHEVRSGLDSAYALGGGDVYYGNADATPLFVMLLGELRRWGVARAEVDALLPHADRALAWIENFGDRDGDGFVEYQRATDRGLGNQGWKDSFDAISFASGGLAEPPIALAEVQGYVYSAYLARAHFAREAGDEDAAGHWADRAAALKRRFNEAFWLPDRGYFALALDRDKRPVDALASNMGHCLWTGIVDEDKAGHVVGHLLSPDMFTGFGIRTLAESMAGYNPMSYHNGSVWPHDNAIAVAGLMRYGAVPEAQRVATAVFDAGAAFDGRLPELFCGFDRAEFSEPVPYPTACSPQAWAAATPLYLLRTLLRFDPWIPFGRLWCAPAVPDRYLPLRIKRLHLAGATLTLDVRGSAWTLAGLPRGIELIRKPRRPLTTRTPPHLTNKTASILTQM